MDISALSAGNSQLFSNRAASDAGDSSQAAGRRDLLKTLNGAFPGMSVSFSDFPADEKDQEKIVTSGQAAGLTISPTAAQRMQTDSGFRDKVIAGIKEDQSLYSDNKVQMMGNTEVEVVSHGTVVDKDGNINGWTLSKSETVSEGGSKSGDAKKSALEALLDRVKRLRDDNKIDKTKADAILKQAEAMKNQSKSDDEIIAAISAAYAGAVGTQASPAINMVA